MPARGIVSMIANDHTGATISQPYAAKRERRPASSRVKINAETMRSDVELMRGLMFRESLAPDRGMLFIHPREATFQYWMYQTKIPLDIIWMDRDRRIVEMSLDTPPCTSSASQCATYGGKFKAKYVLEVKAGSARKNGLKTGDRLDF